MIFCTTTRSPTSSVFSIDSDGMMNIWPTKARSRDDTMSAPMTTNASSFAKDVNRRQPGSRLRLRRGIAARITRVNSCASGPASMTGVTGAGAPAGTPA